MLPYVHPSLVRLSTSLYISTQLARASSIGLPRGRRRGIVLFLPTLKLTDVVTRQHDWLREELYRASKDLLQILIKNFHYNIIYITFKQTFQYLIDEYKVTLESIWNTNRTVLNHTPPDLSNTNKYQKYLFPLRLKLWYG